MYPDTNAVKAPLGARLATRAGIAPWVTTIFLSATLIFLVQPMYAKMATPLLGGSPSVWNVSLVCFQAALLAGYTYAHALARLRSVKMQVAIHAVLLLVAALALPLSISGMFGDPDPSRPILWLVGTFLVSIAPPFAILSATAPLVQNWYACTNRPDADDPYHLYAASNAGSLLGLIAYPVLMEPFASLTGQSLFWSGGYGVVAMLLVTCGLIAFAMSPRTAARAAPADTPDAPAETTSWRERLDWLLLSAVPSALLLGTTSHISTDIAAAPFLWAPPLIAYIATFIIVFSRRPLISTSTATRYLPHAVAIAVILMGIRAPGAVPVMVVIAAHLTVLFLAALCLHGTLADRRPPASRLTEFYLIMSLGGVLGSAFIALGAPVLFDDIIEYPLMLVAALLLRPAAEQGIASLRTHRTLTVTVIGLCFLTLVAVHTGLTVPGWVSSALALFLVAYAVLNAETRSLPALLMGAALFISMVSDPNARGVSERGFFGVVRISTDPETGLRLMTHGTTVHGAQYITDDGAPRPLTYYNPATPIGQAFTRLGSSARSVGVVGLGAGSVACYAQPGQTYTYYEIDPLVAKIARDPNQFTFLSECTPEARIVLGDARISLKDAPVGAYDLLLLDAFSSDSIPVHLMTREAMALYLSRLSDNGVLIFHISNRHVDLTRTVARIGAAENAVMRRQLFNPGKGADQTEASASLVIMLAKSESALAPFADDPRWTVLESDGKRPWTDDYSNLVGALLSGNGVH